MCTVAGPQVASQIVYEEGFSPAWGVDAVSSSTGVTFNPVSNIAGHTGLFALQVTYSAPWKFIILERKNESYEPTYGKKVLVFRIRGVQNTSVNGQMWLRLRDFNYNWLEQVPVARYMINADATGNYDPNTWYTVVIPIRDLRAENTVITGLILESGSATTYYLDDMWLVQGLEFPLAGYTAYTAPMTSVFDHTMTDGNGIVKPFAIDNVVTAYMGEEGNASSNSSLKNVSDGTCISQGGSAFTVNGNYTGAGSCGGKYFLSYDGHPALDYGVGLGTPIYALAAGTVVVSDCLVIPSVVDWEYVRTNGSSCLGLGTKYGKLIINHIGPYTTSFNHLAYVAAGIAVGTNVSTGQLVGYVGNTYYDSVNQAVKLIAPHLHVGLLLDFGPDMYVDPYGWTDWTRPDPYRVKAVNVPLWK